MWRLWRGNKRIWKKKASLDSPAKERIPFGSGSNSRKHGCLPLFFPPLFRRETQSNKSSSPLIPAGAAPHSDKSIPRLKIGRSRWSRAANPKWLISFQLGLVLALSLVLRIVPLLPSRTTRAFRYANVTFEYVRF